MTDFLKVYIYNKNLIEIIWNNRLLEFYEIKEKRVSIDEVKNFYKKSYKNLIFEKCNNRLEISGSIHKFKNNGIHNANQFSFIDSIQTINKIKELFNLDLSLCKIVNLEYGLNLIPDEDVKMIITWLKYHSKNAFNNDYKYSKRSAKFKNNGNLNNYKIFKGYAKGLQRFVSNPYDYNKRTGKQEKYIYKTFGNKNTLRLEVKSKESKYINSLNIYSLNDLIKRETYLRLSNELIKEWGNVLLLDMNLKSKNNKQLNKYLNSDFWETSINYKYRNHFSKHKQKYFKILNQYPENIINQIQSLIQSKLNQFENELIKRGANSTALQNNKGVQIRTNIRLENAPDINLTEINSSMQKEFCTQIKM